MSDQEKSSLNQEVNTQQNLNSQQTSQQSFDSQQTSQQSFDSQQASQQSFNSQQASQQNFNSQQASQQSYNSQYTTGNTFDNNDIEKNKTIAGLAYFLFFLPLIACPDSKFGRYHANQALLLLIVAIAGNIVLGLIPIFGWVLMPFYGMAVFAFGILGLVNALGGKAKPLPLIGQFSIIK